MALTHKQKRVAYHIYSVGKKKGASRKELEAALATALVEANLTNPGHGDRDSVGWRQERSHYGSKGRRMNVRGAASRYFDETKAAGRGRGKTPGQLAQSVQRSAFPGRYDERLGQARAVLRHLEKTQGKAGAVRGAGGRRYGTKTTVERIPGVDNSEMRQQLKASYLANRNNPNALLELAGGLQDAQDVPAQRIERTNLTSKKIPGVKGGGGARDAKGRRTKTDIERIAALAKKMGLHVGGNLGVQGHRETSGHTANSNHYKNARKKGWQGALDISGDPRKMAKLAGYLSRRYGRDMEELIYRGPGSKDRHNIKRGRRVGKGFYSAHEDHVHVADLD